MNFVSQKKTLISILNYMYPTSLFHLHNMMKSNMKCWKIIFSLLLFIINHYHHHHISTIKTEYNIIILHPQVENENDCILMFIFNEVTFVYIRYFSFYPIQYQTINHHHHTKLFLIYTYIMTFVKKKPSSNSG